MARTRLRELGRSLMYLAGTWLTYGLLALLLVVLVVVGWFMLTLVSSFWFHVRGTEYLAGGEGFGIAVVALLLTVGVLVVPYLVVLRWWADRELHRTGRFLGRRLEPFPPLAVSDLRGGLRSLFGTLSTWRAVAWVCAQATAGLALVALALAPLVAVVDAAWGLLLMLTYSGGPVLLEMVSGFLVELGFFVPYAAFLVPLAVAGQLAGGVLWLGFGTPALARLHAGLTARVLAGSLVAALEERVDVLAETRAGAVDAHMAELRRIERDLHDGMQAQLVNVSMRLGMAERRLADDPAAVGELIRDARSGTEEAMGELRSVLRTMYPPVLADRGLRGALSGLAGRCAIPTTVDIPELDDLPAPVEAAAYFVVAEALTNVAKHSGASQADVRVRREPRSVAVEVTDNGVGGADEQDGTGIVGMRRRIAALDGWLEVVSPTNGPTVIVAELPCGS